MQRTRKRRKIINVSAVILTALLSACQTTSLASLTPSATSVPGVQEIRQPSPTSTVLAPTKESTPSKTQTPSPTPTEIDSQTDCFTVVDDIQSIEGARGWVVLRSIHKELSNKIVSPSSLGSMILTNERVTVNDVRVAPSYSRIAYRRAEYASASLEGDPKVQLVVSAGDGREISVVPWQAEWVGIAGMISDTSVVLNLAGSDPNENQLYQAATLGNLDTNTGRIEPLKAEYPNIMAESPMPNWNNWGSTVYNRTLEEVAYPMRLIDSYAIGVFSRPTNALLAKVPTWDPYRSPAWSPDSALVVFAANYMKPTGEDIDLLRYELFRVGIDGSAAQVTNFLSVYKRTYFKGLSWSPDSTRVAYWLNVDPESELFLGEQHLVVTDVATGMTTDTCVQGDYNATAGPDTIPAPVWSPTGDYLAISNRYSSDGYRPLIVDLDSRVATRFDQDGFSPVAWAHASP